MVKLAHVFPKSLPLHLSLLLELVEQESSFIFQKEVFFSHLIGRIVSLPDLILASIEYC